MLDRVDVHCVWISPAVLRLLPDSIPDVDGGEVVREPGLGVFCDNAVSNSSRDCAFPFQAYVGNPVLCGWGLPFNDMPGEEW